MTNRLILAGALAAFVLPSMATAQEAQPTTSAMSSTADSTGNYTITRRTAGEMMTGSDTSSAATTSTTANTNTDPADIQRTIDANPGLAEALQSEGVMVDQIGSISVEPNGQVVIYDRT